MLSQKGHEIIKPDGFWVGVSDGDLDDDVDEKVEVESTVESGDAARDVKTAVEDSSVLELKRKVITVKDRDGAETNVGKVCRETCRDALRKITEQNRRAAGTAKAPAKSSTGSGGGGGGGGGALDKTQDETAQAMSDPLLVFLQCNEGVTVALEICEQFKGPDGTEGLTEIKVSTMADTKCAVAASVMKPPLSSSAESPSTLLFSPASFLGKVDVSGAAVRILNPELRS